MKRDLLVIGTGPAASRVARKCAAAGWTVAIAEKREFGGTCALRGCNPKKVFVRAAELLDWTRRADGRLIRSTNPHINWSELVAFKREFTDGIPTRSRESYEDAGISTLHGAARFLNPQTVQVGDTTVEARHILIGTGARPAPLDFSGHEHVMTSDDFMELDELPSRLLFIGGGYISFEFAHVAVRAGADVTIVEHSDRLLRHFSRRMVDELAEYSRSLGIRLLTQRSINSLTRTDEGGFRIEMEAAGKAESVTADLAIHGAGRVPDLGGLDLPAGGVEASGAGVTVDEYMRSISSSHVFAAGDCAATDQPLLTPVANQQARAIASTLLTGKPGKPDYGSVPTAVFTIPALASVGLTEQQAREQNRDFEVRHGDMSDWSSIRKVAGSCGAYELIIERDTEQILGAHLLGPEAAETINLFALAMKFQLTARNLKSVLMTFPTFASDVREMI